MARLIAFVGSEASGKSTIIDEVERWLRPRHPVLRVHAGKPPSTALTFLPHVLLPTLRTLFPRQRTLRVERGYVEEAGPRAGPFPLLFGIRAVMLAYERRALLLKASRAGNEAIVLSDRYPLSTRGSPDGPQLAHLPIPRGPLSLRRALATLETRMYRDIPSPELLFHLWAPLEVTLARNAARDKREPEEHVRFRHAQTVTVHLDGAPVHRIQTDRDLELVVKEIQEVIGGSSIP